MGLPADQDLALGARGANSAGLVHGATNQGELRLGLADNTRDHVSCVNADPHGELLSILQCHGVRILLDDAGEVNDSDRMVASKQTRVDGPLADLEATACHVRLSDGLNLLDAILLTELVEGIVSVVEQLNQVASILRLHNPIEAHDVNKDYFDFIIPENKIKMQ